LACNLFDDDCDGCIDGTVVEGGACAPSNTEDFDIVYIIDTSGSMLSVHDAVKEAMRTFTATYQHNPHFRFGLLLVPGPADGVVYMSLPLSVFEDFIIALDTDVVSYGGALEPSYDAIRALGDDTLRVGWRREATRIIILFTDEDGQSFLSPTNTEHTACSSLDHGEYLAVVTRLEFMASFDECGHHFPLTLNSGEMATSLSEIISDPCSM